MAEDKQIDCAVASGKSVAKDLATTFVDCYKSLFDIELKIDDIEKMALDIIPEQIVLCDIPIYINKLTALVQEIASIPAELIAALNAAITGVVTDIQEKAQELAEQAMDKVNSAVDKAKDAVNDAKEAVQEKIDEVKEAVQEKVDEVKEAISEKKDEMTETLESLNIPLEAIKYSAMGIILKRFQIIKYRCEMIQKCILILLAKLRKKILMDMLSGKEDAGSAVSTAIKTFLLGIAATATLISNVVSILVNFINNIFILNIDASGCVFGPTPKNLWQTSKMTIANENQSTTCPIPRWMDELITKAENKIIEANGKIKKAQVAAMSSAAAATVASGGAFSLGDFPELPKFDSSIIRTAVNALIMALFDAESLPRYEKLTPINIRFMVFLVTGFEPAAQKTFGIPGFP